MRNARLDLAAILATPNPQIDIKIKAYDDSTRSFLAAVSRYSNRAVAEITNRKNAHHSEKKRIADKTQQMQAETNQCKLKEIELINELEREQEENKEAESSVAALRRQLASIREQCALVDVEVEQYRTLTSNLRREKSKERSILDSHATRLSPELGACEIPLQCIIEGIDKDRLLFRFSHIDSSDLSREFSFVIDVSSRVYRVLTSTPVLPTLPILIDQLNESRDVYAFVKNIRLAFADLCSVH
ncbi:hypothetical protein JAAARDRAFT_134528 [Jaapia argillacea MUCL 33604]|uniref:Kinetochore protein SPC25 n=1 Tax=Jaapia argillacea MUCL 33604 TaxID=933084 RepID=A0A067PJC7_9AGAM|nr:hypothetical protein JAAARDRAFT_134528 [Jaapia argillacea MUCL 33604]